MDEVARSDVVSAGDAVSRGDVAGMVPERWLGATIHVHGDQPRTIVALLDHAVRHHPHAVGVVAGDREVPWGEVAELVEGAAAHLRDDLGLARGDRLAVALGNGLDLLVAIWAAARAGLVLVALPTRLTAPQWAHQLQVAQPVLALGDEAHLARLQEAAAEAGATPVRAVEDHLTGRRQPWRGLDGGWAPGPDDVYALIFTSGTTGRPKGSMVTHRGTTHAAVTYTRAFGLTAADTTLLTFPLYYATAHMAQVSPMMLVGGRVVLLEGDVTPAAVVDRCARHDVSYLMVVPALWPLLLRTRGFAGEDLPALRIGAFGGAPVPLASLARLREAVPAMRLYDAYGLTETHSPATILLDEEMADRPGSVGRPIAGTEARVVDDDGRDVPRGRAGELLLRGPNITPGYWGAPEATAAAIDADGWFATGDVARIDDEGYVFLLDRKKDMIIRGGFKVFSVEVEYALVEHPDVAEAAVVGVPDRLGSEYVVAYVVPREGAVPDPRALADHVRERVADYAVPRRVHLVGSIPRNRTGKVDKVVLRELGGGPAADRS